MSEEKNEPTFEEALIELQATVEKLESGDLTLEESLAIYERGQQLVAYCSQRLENASLKVEQLSTEGEIIELDA